MKASKKRNAIRVGNRFGKTEMGMEVNACPKPRRSIPIAEVNQMIEHAERQIKASLTIYDDRLEILKSLERNEANIESINAMLHEAKLQNKRIRSDLASVNLAITRRLELDGE